MDMAVDSEFNETRRGIDIKIVRNIAVNRPFEVTPKAHKKPRSRRRACTFPPKRNQKMNQCQPQWHSMIDECVNSDDGNGHTIFRIKKKPSDPLNAARKEEPHGHITCRQAPAENSHGRTQVMLTAGKKRQGERRRKVWQQLNAMAPAS
jgi:hypothetical protein